MPKDHVWPCAFENCSFSADRKSQIVKHESVYHGFNAPEEIYLPNDMVRD